MQISSMIQPMDIQSPDFKVSKNPAVEKVEKRPAEVQEPPREAGEHSEKFQELKSALAEHNITLDFSRDEATDEIVVRLIDDQTGEALQQFPSEVSLKLAATFAKLQGQFVDEKI